MFKGEYGVGIYGFGPAGTGVLVGAANRELLGPILDRGVVAVDAGEVVGPGYLSQAGIESNSPGPDFLEELSGPFDSMRGQQSGKNIAAVSDAPVPSLREYVAPVLVDVGAVASKVVTESGGEVKTGTGVYDIEQVHADGRSLYVARTPQGLIATEGLVLAVGAEQVLDHDLVQHREKIVFSGDVVAGSHGQVEKAVANNQKIVVKGGSHSSFSVAGELIEKYGRDLEPGQVVVAHRSPVKVFQLLPDGTKVHRFDGIRNRQARLFEDIVAGREDRVALQPVDTPAQAAGLYDQAGAIVQATGYKARRVPITRDGREIGPKLASDGQIDVDGLSRVKGHDGAILPNAWATGLGAGLRSTEGNVRLDGVNVYQGTQGRRIAHGLARMG